MQKCTTGRRREKALEEKSRRGERRERRKILPVGADLRECPELKHRNCLKTVGSSVGQASRGKVNSFILMNGYIE